MTKDRRIFKLNYYDSASCRELLATPPGERELDDQAGSATLTETDWPTRGTNGCTDRLPGSLELNLMEPVCPAFEAPPRDSIISTDAGGNSVPLVSQFLQIS